MFWDISDSDISVISWSLVLIRLLLLGGSLSLMQWYLSVTQPVNDTSVFLFSSPDDSIVDRLLKLWGVHSSLTVSSGLILSPSLSTCSVSSVTGPLVVRQYTIPYWRMEYWLMLCSLRIMCLLVRWGSFSWLMSDSKSLLMITSTSVLELRTRHFLWITK